MLEIIQVAKLDKVHTKIRGIDIDIAVDINTITQNRGKHCRERYNSESGE